MPTTEIIAVGTSEFLANNQVHIGDTMYFINAAPLKESATLDSNNVVDVNHSIDVKLLGILDEEWCKVAFDDTEGFIPSSNLTSASVTPDIVEKNRIQRILLGVNIDMDLSKPSGLTLDDYEKIFSDLSQDTNNIFKDNYSAFYEMENKYHINGIFLASIAIHESGWGTSQIAKDKKNLFGFGAYDSNPYEYAVTFSSYSDGIEEVAQALAKNYLFPAGTEIYDGEIARGIYHNGTTVESVNIRYASDPNWYTKVFNYMDMLYNRL